MVTVPVTSPVYDACNSYYRTVHNGTSFLREYQILHNFHIERCRNNCHNIAFVNKYNNYQDKNNVY